MHLSNFILVRRVLPFCVPLPHRIAILMSAEGPLSRVPTFEGAPQLHKSKYAQAQSSLGIGNQIVSKSEHPWRA